MSSVEERKSKLEALKKARVEGKKDNIKLIEASSNINHTGKTIAALMALERKNKKLDEIKKKLENQDVDPTIVKRKNDLEYSISDVERWKVIQEEKDDRMNNGFTDFSQKANKKYKKTVGDFQPNLQEYNRLKEETNPDDFYRDAHSLAFITAGSSNSQRGIDKLANEIETQAKKRKEFSRRRAFDEEADVTFINERNMRFNKKISRSFDKYTKDIKDSFERGTAL